MSATSKPGFFSNGDTIACFCELGRRPSANDALTMLVMYCNSKSVNLRTRKVGTGSSAQDMIGDVSTMRQTSVVVHDRSDDNVDGDGRWKIGSRPSTPEIVYLLGEVGF